MFSKKNNLETTRKIPSWIEKMLDPKKEMTQKFQYFKKIIDNMDPSEHSDFFNNYPLEIFVIFYEEFMHLETNVKSKGGIKACFDCFVFLCTILKTIILSFPLLIKQHWQYNSIYYCLKKLAHSKSYPKARCYGLEIYIIWIQALQDPNDEYSLELLSETLNEILYHNSDSILRIDPSLNVKDSAYNTPSFSVLKSVSIESKVLSLSTKASAELFAFTWEEATPSACIPTSEKLLIETEKIDLIYFEKILEFFTANLLTVKCKDKGYAVECFKCNFTLIQKIIVNILFPSAVNSVNMFYLKQDNFSLFVSENIPEPSCSPISLSKLQQFKDAFTKWLLDIITRSSDSILIERSIATSNDPGKHNTLSSESMQLIKSGGTTIVAETNKNDDLFIKSSERDESLIGINASIKLARNDHQNAELSSIIHTVFFTNRENISCIFEVFRQNFLSSKCSAEFSRRILYIFYNWLKSRQKLEFVNFSSDPTDNKNQETSENHKINNRFQIYHQKFIRFLVYIVLSSFYSEPSTSSSYFLIIPQLKRSLRFIRILIFNTHDILDPESWQKIIDALLDVYSLIINSNLKNQLSETNTLSESVTIFLTYLCETILIIWIKANFKILLPPYLWDKFSNLLINGFYYKELFSKWKEACEIITALFCLNIFNINIYNLKLNASADTKKKNRLVQKKTQNIEQNKNTFSRIMGPKQRIPSLIAEKNINQIFPDLAKAIILGEKPNNNEKVGKTTNILEINYSKSNIENELHEQLYNTAPPSTYNTEENPDSKFSPLILSDATQLISNQKSKVLLENTVQPKDTLENDNSNIEIIKEKSLTKSPILTDLSYELLLPIDSHDRNSMDYDSKTSESSIDTHIKDIIKPNMQTEILDIANEKYHDNAIPEEIADQENNKKATEPYNFDNSEKDNALELSDFNFHNQPILSEHRNKEHMANLWKRTIGLFGNLNDLKDPMAHSAGFNIFIYIFEKLEEVAKNYGIDEKSKFVLPSDTEYPPIDIFLPLCLECLYNYRENYNKGYLAAEVLLLKYIYSPYQLNTLSTEILIHFIEISKKILINGTRAHKNEFFRYSSSLLSSKARGEILLFSPILNAISETLDFKDPSVPHFEISVLLLSMVCHFLLSSNKTVEMNNLTELKPLYFRIAIKYSTQMEHSFTRINALRILFQSSFEHILKNRKSTFTSFVLTILVKHLYSKNYDVLNVVCSMLYSYVGILDELTKLIPNVIFVIFKECCDALKNLANFETEVAKEKCNIYNIEIILLDLLLLIILKIKHQDNKLLEIFYATMIRLFKSNETIKHIDISNSPNSMFQLLLGEKFTDAKSIFNESLTNIQDVSQSLDVDSTDSSNQTDTREFSSPYAQMPIDPEERYNSFLSKVEHVANFCTIMLNNFPFILGSECLSSLILEEDLIENIQEMSSNCLAACINNEIIMVLVDSSDDKRNLNIYKHNYSEKDFYFDNASTLINIRTPLGKFSWLISELISYPQQSLLLSESKLLSLPNSEQPYKSFLKMDDKLEKILNHAYSQFPESANNYEYTKTKSSYTHLIANSSYISRVRENIEKNIQPASNKKYSHELVSDQSQSQQFSRASVPECKIKYKQRLSSLIFSQFGYFFNENRSNVIMLSPTDRFFKDAKQLDQRLIRFSHKIAVFYIKRGQEDKESIYQNRTTSPEFSAFISGLGWPINLATHLGFIGGLDKSCSTGSTATYYSSPIDEVIYHVAPHMPLNDSVNGMIAKVRHLGNDEVHIVWSEHFRPFRRSIINTEFGDVIIIIYPMENGLYKINILGRPYITSVGPLTDGCIVSFQSLPVLVRETALNASRIIRMNLSIFKTTYEDRLNVIQQLKDKHRIKESFENYISQFLLDKSEK